MANKFSDKEKQTFKEMADIASVLTERTQEIADNIGKTGENLATVVDASIKQAKQGKITNDLLKSRVDLIQEIAKGELSSTDISSKKRNIEDEMTKISRRYWGNNKKIGQQKIKDLQVSIDLLDVEENRIKASAQANSILSEVDGVLGGMGSIVADFITNPLTIASAVLLAFSANLDAVGEEFGAIGLQNDKLRTGLLDSSAQATKLGKGFSDIAESMTTLTTEFGVGLMGAEGMALSIVDTSMALGLTNVEGGQLIGSLMTISGLSAETATNLAKQTTLLATSNDVAPKQVLQDIASSSEVTAKFTNASGENILRGAIQARKLGTNLETAASAAESMLNFQDSIQGALEASVLIGRDINIQKLQELSLAGDLEGVSKEQRRLLGDQSDFLSMNVIQREALAKSVGLSVDQAAKMLSHEKDAISLSGELAKQEGFESLIGANTISELTQLIGSLKSIAAVLVNVLGPPLNIIVGVFSVLASGLQTMITLFAQYTPLIYTAAAALGVFHYSAIRAAIAGIWKSAFTGPGAVLGGPAGIGLGIAAALGGVGALLSSTGAVALAEGGITKGPTNALIGEKGTEAVIPIEKLKEFMAEAMIPVTTAVVQLNEDFNKKYIPALVTSNAAGGKLVAKEIVRKFDV